jgi:hypothetical protein
MGSGRKGVGHHLNDVKDMVLSWEEPAHWKALENNKGTPAPQWPSKLLGNEVLKNANKPGPFEWTRQIAFLKDKGETETALGDGLFYYIFRDTVHGLTDAQGQVMPAPPTEWMMWTLSNRIVPAASFDPDDPFYRKYAENSTYVEKTQGLGTGKRYTAVGQVWRGKDNNKEEPAVAQKRSVHVEYYVASPSNKYRYRMRWGRTFPYGIPGVFHPLRTYMDGFYLRQESEGSFFVAVFPRKHVHHVPMFDTVGAGKVIRVHGLMPANKQETYSDYVYLCADSKLSLDSAVVKEDATKQEAPAYDLQNNKWELSFRGSMGSVRFRKEGMLLSVGEDWRLQGNESRGGLPSTSITRVSGQPKGEYYSVTSHGSVFLQVTDTNIKLELPLDEQEERTTKAFDVYIETSRELVLAPGSLTLVSSSVGGSPFVYKLDARAFLASSPSRTLVCSFVK